MRPGRAWALLAAAAAACGYSAGGALDDLPVRSVAVRVAGNESFRQRFEIPLTRRIIEDLSVHSTVTPARADQADAILEVVAEDIEGQVLSSGTTPIREGAILVSINAVLRERSTGRVLRQARILDRAEYRVPVGETLAGAEQESIRDLARRVILAMEPQF